MSDTDDSENEILQKAPEKYKRGIIYLSTIPKFMNVTKVREVFERYGEVDRIFLQPEEPRKKQKKNQPAKHFTEGWVEFKKKRVAKQVAEMLNNKPIADRKRSRFYDFIWNIKYLSRFKWVHLSERLAYERAVHKQRMRTEIAQVKREANFFAHNVDVSEQTSRKGKKKTSTEKDQSSSIGQGHEILMHHFKQRETDQEIIDKKQKKLVSASGLIKKKKKAAHKMASGPLDEESRKDLLSSLFRAKSS